MKKVTGSQSKKSNSRKRSFGKTNPNFNSLIKQETESFLAKWGHKIKSENPEVYYSMINRPLPKKYQKTNYPIAPVNAYVPPQSKLSKEELDKQMEEEAKERREKEEALRIKKEKERKEQERIRYNRETYERERKYIRWVDPNEPINRNRLGSSQVWRKEKKYRYYD